MDATGLRPNKLRNSLSKSPGSTLKTGISPSNLFSNTGLPKLLVQQWDD